ncbi:MAG: hypothetical protein AMXMBFR7_16270 [Planctomycetota bacterium]
MHRPNQAPQDPPDDSEDTQSIEVLLNHPEHPDRTTPGWRNLLRAPNGHLLTRADLKKEKRNLAQALLGFKAFPDLKDDLHPGFQRAMEPRIWILSLLLRGRRPVPAAWYDGYVEHVHHVCKRQEEPEPPDRLKADRKELAFALHYAEQHPEADGCDRWTRLNLEARIRMIRHFLRRGVTRLAYTRIANRIIRHTAKRGRHGLPASKPAHTPDGAPRDWKEAHREVLRWEHLFREVPHLAEEHPAFLDRLKRNNAPPAEPERTPAKPPLPPDAKPGGIQGPECYELDPRHDPLVCKATGDEHEWVPHAERGHACCLCGVHYKPLDGGPATPEDLFDLEGGAV